MAPLLPPGVRPRSRGLLPLDGCLAGTLEQVSCPGGQSPHLSSRRYRQRSGCLRSLYCWALCGGRKRQRPVPLIWGAPFGGYSKILRA